MAKMPEYAPIPLSSYQTGASADKRRDLKRRLLESVELVEDHDEFEENDFRWAETKIENGRARVFINDKRFQLSGAGPKYREKMVFAESLHNLKNIDPDRYNRMEESALNDPTYREWAEQSYLNSKGEYGETRSFEDWHRESRFDQIIGGYLYAEDEDIPSMKNWRRGDLPWGDPLKKELKKLAADLGMK